MIGLSLIHIFHCGIECRHVTVGQLLNIQKSAVIFLKLDIFHLFIGKCLDHLMAQQTILDPGVQLSDLVTLLAKGTSHPEIQDHAHTAHQRHAQKDHQCQRQIALCQNDKRDYGLDCGDEKFFWAMIDVYKRQATYIPARVSIKTVTAKYIFFFIVFRTQAFLRSYFKN